MRIETWFVALRVISGWRTRLGAGLSYPCNNMAIEGSATGVAVSQRTGELYAMVNAGGIAIR